MTWSSGRKEGGCQLVAPCIGNMEWVRGRKMEQQEKQMVLQDVVGRLIGFGM